MSFWSQVCWKIRNSAPKFLFLHTRSPKWQIKPFAIAPAVRKATEFCAINHSNYHLLHFIIPHLFSFRVSLSPCQLSPFLDVYKLYLLYGQFLLNEIFILWEILSSSSKWSQMAISFSSPAKHLRMKKKKGFFLSMPQRQVKFIDFEVNLRDTAWHIPVLFVWFFIFICIIFCVTQTKLCGSSLFRADKKKMEMNYVIRDCFCVACYPRHNLTVEGIMMPHRLLINFVRFFF